LVLRILTIAARPFYPADTGGRIRSSQLFERLARMHQVTILCFTTAEDGPGDVARMRTCCSELETVEWQEAGKFTPRFYAELAASLGSTLPYTVRKYRSAAMRQAIRRRLATADYDLLVCDFLQPSINCIDEPFRPKVLFQHNVEAVIQERQAQYATNHLARAYLHLEAAKLGRYERRAAEEFEHCIMVSDEDCHTMRARYGARNTSVAPTGVDVDYFTPEPERFEPEIVFVGSMDWLPNQDAVTYFVSEILPRIRAVVPVTFSIVGRNPPERIRQYAQLPYVRVTGTVGDVRPYIAGARVCVLPLRIGGGTRIKIFEAMAMERAIVSTTIGAEGLPVTHGENIVLADTPAEFSTSVIELLQSPATRAGIAAAGRRLVSSHFTWEAAARSFSAICQGVVEQRRRSVTASVGRQSSIRA
jgi:sugar transferase (PEP-CTERM/EpsH1 system associated)